MLATALALLLVSGFANDQSTSSGKQPTFAMSIRLKQNAANPGGTVTVDVDLTNTSDKEIVFFTHASVPEYNWAVTTKERGLAPLTPKGNALAHGTLAFKGSDGKMRMMGGGSVFSTRVKPGKIFHDSIDISDYVDLSRPDDYKIRFVRTDQYTNITVESNTVTLTVAR